MPEYIAQMIGLDLVIRAAEQHGQDDNPDHEVGDLQDALREMWSMLTPAQQLEFMVNETLVERIEVGMVGDDEFDIQESQDAFFEQVQSEHQNRRADASINSLVYSDMVVQFPGLLDGETDVNGGDLVDWVCGNLERFRALEQSVQVPQLPVAVEELSSLPSIPRPGQS